MTNPDQSVTRWAAGLFPLICWRYPAAVLSTRPDGGDPPR
jgi:hypothetical protein